MKKILIIEDELLLREGISEILTFEGFEVHQAANGEEGLQAVSQNLPDLILCDIMMPVMDGYEATQVIRSEEIDPEHHITIVAMTVNAMEGDREACLAAGLHDYIAKPIRPQDLTEAIERWKSQAEKMAA